MRIMTSHSPAVAASIRAFISYRRDDSEHATARIHDLLRERFGAERVFHDTATIPSGDEWPERIRNAVDTCSVMLAVIGPQWLSTRLNKPSDWVRQELSRGLERGIRVIPVLVAGSKMPPRDELPGPLQPLVDRNEFTIHRDPYFVQSVNALADAIAPLVGASNPAARIASDAATAALGPAAPTEPHLVSIGRLPQTDALLLGRDAELRALDAAWGGTARSHVVSFVAWGGTGKTALVNHWLAGLAQHGYRGARRVLGWSFYSQGTSEARGASADEFVVWALGKLGDREPSAGSPYERLARLLQKERTLLVLDGVEPLQYPPGPEEGRFKDRAFGALLRELCAHNPGLCVLTSRLRLADLGAFEGRTAKTVELVQLAPEAGAELLHWIGVHGRREELREAVEEYGGHALALRLLGNYLIDACACDVRRRHELGPLVEADVQGAHARRVMAGYERWFGIGPECDLLRLLGLFDRPARKEGLEALRAPPAIVGLTEAVVGLGERGWNQALARLRRARLVEPADPREPETVDAHPLVREHFGEQLRRDKPAAWREGHRRLYGHYRAAAKELPETLEEIAPLYAAVTHGCHAGLHQEALDEVYRWRICRGDEFYATKKLGAYGTDLVALAGFFAEAWTRPQPTLTEADRALVLGLAGFNLRAMGRLREATEPFRAGLERYLALQAWKNAARAASNLSELHLVLGEVVRAVEYATEAVDLADRSGDTFQRMARRTMLASAFHQAGQMDKAAKFFVAAEELLKKSESGPPLLYSVPGYSYCDLLLDRGAVEDVLPRAMYALVLSEKERWLLDLALNHLTLGRAYLFCARRGDAPSLDLARRRLALAVDGLRNAGSQHFVPRGLLARADLFLLTGEPRRARADLDEALEIATRGSMRLHEADGHLGYARLHLAAGQLAEARRHADHAATLIRETGYARRQSELDELTQQLTPP
jgi:tetratricopeptide (TPR) repeat protein